MRPEVARRSASSRQFAARSSHLAMGNSAIRRSPVRALLRCHACAREQLNFAACPAAQPGRPAGSIMRAHYLWPASSSHLGNFKKRPLEAPGGQDKAGRVSRERAPASPSERPTRAARQRQRQRRRAINLKWKWILPAAQSAARQQSELKVEIIFLDFRHR